MAGKQPKRSPREGVDEYGRTPLVNAVIDRDEDLVRREISAGADVNKGDDEGWTPLHFAAQDHSLAIAKQLLAAGAVIDPQDANGNTPLWRAVMNAYHGDNFIAFLKKSGADPNIKNAYDISAHDLETNSA